MKIISLGLGIQSTALYLMSSLGELPRADSAVFADTGGEAQATYEYRDFLKSWERKHGGIRIITCTDKNLHRDLVNLPDKRRFMPIPAFTKNGDGTTGMLRRQCTSEYKIRVIDDYIRDHVYKLPKGARRPATEVWLGITTDEAERASISRAKWKTNCYPFLSFSVDYYGNITPNEWSHRRSRADLEQWYRLNGFPIPPKSACVFCPYQSDHAWAKMKRTSPADFTAAVKVDEAIRNSTERGANNPVFLHRSCIPLSEIEFDETLTKTWGECSGTCHV